MSKKVISVNLWYDKYYEKTNAQLKSFRKLGFITHVMTVKSVGNTLTCEIGTIGDGMECYNIVHTITVARLFNLGYLHLFSSFFKYVINEKYDFVYIRRLMLKIVFIVPFIKSFSKCIPIVYEIPTWPLDKTYGKLQALKNIVEFSIFNIISKYFDLIPVVLCDNISVPDKWFPFLNSIDIDRYPFPVPSKLTDTVNILTVSNMANSHRYERLLYAIKNYKGNYKIHVTMISRDTEPYNNVKKLARELGLSDIIDFHDEMKITEVAQIAGKYHLGIGILTYGEKKRTIDTSLKNKDYCAMGLPFISTCKDLSFLPPFPYHYIVDNSSYEFDLEPIIKWYEVIYQDSSYRDKMYEYAKNNLQYDNTAKEIVKIICK